MMSLFSNFDMNFLNSKLIYLFLILNFLSILTFKMNKFNLIKETTKKTIENLYYPLKNSPFNKMMIILILNLFILLSIVNFLSVLPFNFCWTTQLSMVLMICLSIWLSLNMFMILKNLKNLISHCIPEGTPIYLTWLLFLIELISNFIRPVTLSVRLTANILAGHLLLTLLANLVFNYTSSMIFHFLLTSVEMFVALIQAYIFTTMIALYYSELA